MGHNQPIPMVQGNKIANLNIIDDKCLQCCLILASEDDHQILANRTVDAATVYKCESIQGRIIYSIEQSKKSKKLLIS